MLNYNENKVKAGVAECIHENLYHRPLEKLTFHDKLNGMMNYAERNRRVISNAVHISLNFHPDEKLDNDQVKEIADVYMQKIGFGEQPYLVYRHHDAAHPHIHIVSTNIKQSGERIVMYNIGRNQSEKARQEIEKDFKLITAAGRRFGVDRPSVIASADTGNSQRAIYGKTETRRSIANAINRALSYKFTSLPEFNAVLRQFNVVADRGSEGSITFQKNGLAFFLTDKAGKKIGVPIKASSFHNKPTLKNLEKLFKQNEALRLTHRDRIKQCIDTVLLASGKMSDRKFCYALNQEKIFVLFRQNAEGLVYGITFVDNKNKVVFNGSDLGKAYSAKAINEEVFIKPAWDPSEQRALESDHPTELEQVITDLTTAQQYGSNYDPYARKKKKKIKRSR